MSQLLPSVKITKVADRTIAGTTAINGASVDMQNFEGVLIFGKMDTANAANTVNAAQSSDNTNFDDLANTKVTPGDNGDVFKLDIKNPTDRYVRLEVARGVSTAVGEIYAIRYGPRKEPVANDDAESHVSPDEGTA